MNDLIGTGIYKFSRKGAGYRKYVVVNAKGFHDENKTYHAIIEIKGTHWRKENSKPEYINVSISNNQIIGLPPQYFTNLIEFFLSHDQINKKCKKQFLHEKEEIKAKYPEYFL